MFKGLLVASLIGTTWLFVRLLPVRSWIEAVCASLALLILFGHHSFAGAVEGVYPWGVEIVLVACQIAVLGFLLRERTLASEVGAVALSVFALVLNEKGGAVGATYIVGAILRMPGGSIRAAACTFAAYVGVLALRFFVFRSLFALGGKRVEAIPMLGGSMPLRLCSTSSFLIRSTASLSSLRTHLQASQEPSSWSSARLPRPR